MLAGSIIIFLLKYKLDNIVLLKLYWGKAIMKLLIFGRLAV